MNRLAPALFMAFLSLIISIPSAQARVIDAPETCSTQLIPQQDDFIDANGQKWGKRETLADGGCSGQIDFITIVAHLYGLFGSIEGPTPTVNTGTCGPCKFYPNGVHTGWTVQRQANPLVDLCSVHRVDATYLTGNPPGHQASEKICQ